MFYDVYDEWTQSTCGSDTINNYYKLLLLVKTKSKKDNVWISFVEGLHRHAAIIACLLCTKFDYKNNIIKPGSLQLEDFKKADIPHYKDPGYNPKEFLKMIFSDKIAAPMLTSQFTFQAYIPKKLDGEIQPIMDNMKIHSLWVSINKIDLARKTISKSLWSFFSHIMTYSKKRNDHDVRPQWMDTDTFKYQEQITIQKYTKVLESKKMKTPSWASQNSSPALNGTNISKILSILQQEKTMYNMCPLYKIPKRVETKSCTHLMG